MGACQFKLSERFDQKISARKMATSNSQEDFIEGERIMETIKSQEQWILIIDEYSEAKRNAKLPMARVLNKLASLLSVGRTSY